MSALHILKEHAAEVGWTEQTMFELACEFITEHGHVDEFAEYVAAAVKEDLSAEPVSQRTYLVLDTTTGKAGATYALERNAQSDAALLDRWAEAPGRYKVKPVP